MKHKPQHIIELLNNTDFMIADLILDYIRTETESDTVLDLVDGLKDYIFTILLSIWLSLSYVKEVEEGATIMTAVECS